jgi:ATP-dependent RNA helicase DDX51/DBP6
LYLLLSAIPAFQPKVEQFSGTLTADQRGRVLAKFRRGAISILVASDAMARGLDVEEVTAVVNYDTPVYPKSYIHRAGRTARAGKEGQVFTLVRPEDMRHFRGLMRKLEGGEKGLREMKLPQQVLQELRPVLKGALGEVQGLLEAERAEQAAAAEVGGGGGGMMLGRGGGGNKAGEKRGRTGREIGAKGQEDGGAQGLKKRMRGDAGVL